MGITGARLVSGRPREVGARGRQSFELGGRLLEAEIEITAADPGRRFAYRTVGGVPFTFEGVIDVEPIGPQQSRAVWSGWIEFEPAMAAMEAEMSGAFQDSEAAELRRLKEVLEAGAASSPADSLRTTGGGIAGQDERSS